MQNLCVLCGMPIPEGVQFCKGCDEKTKPKKKTDLEKAISRIYEEYERAKKLEYVRNPLAFALHNVWKEVDKHK